MLRLKNLSNKYQKRLVRPLYAQTQATPYSAVLDPSLRNTDGSIRKPLAADTVPVTRSADAFTLKNGLVPGTVMLKGAGEGMVVASGANAAEIPFGILANFVGGDLDELNDENQIGVWRGSGGAVFEIIAPAFDDTGLAAAYAAATPGNPVKLYAGVDGRLVYVATPGSRVPVAHLIQRVDKNRIVIDLKV